jgi:hypothetical protein
MRGRVLRVGNERRRDAGRKMKKNLKLKQKSRTAFWNLGAEVEAFWNLGAVVEAQETNDGFLMW